MIRHHEGATRWFWLSFWIVVTFIIVAMLLLVVFLGFGVAHELYPSECCAEQHCHPVACGELHANAYGYQWNGMEFVWQTVRASHDGRCHVCHMGSTPVCIMPGSQS